MKLPKPEFFDIFGALAFLYITTFSLWALFMKKEIPRLALWILFLIGLVGLIVDTAIVYRFYFS